MDYFLSALSAPYFEETSKKVLDKFFQKYGFRLNESNETKIVYSKGDIFLEIYYYPEDIPNYSLIISIGFIEKDKDFTGYDGVGLWYALYQSGDVINYQNWKFSAQEELESNLIGIRDDIIEKYAKSLWEKPDKLRSLIDSQLNESRSKYEEQVRSQRLQKAKLAFNSGLYNEAVEIFEKIGVSNLSAIELQMYTIGKNHLVKP